MKWIEIENDLGQACYVNVDQIKCVQKSSDKTEIFLGDSSPIVIKDSDGYVKVVEAIKSLVYRK